MLRGFLTRLRARLFRGRHEAELAEELRYHLEREIERLVAAGRTPAAARAEALRGFGRISEHQDDVRKAWRWSWVAEIGQDVRFALRGFRREPSLVATVMLTIGLGVGPAAAAFTLFNAYVLRPMPVLEPAALEAVEWSSRDRASRNFSTRQYEELTRLPVVAGAVGYRVFTTRSEGRQTAGEFVTGNYFTMLGVRPALGRVLLPGDAEAAGGGQVAVVTHRYWRSRLGGDSAAIGKTLSIRGTRLAIVGVAAAGFDGLAGHAPDYWAPITIAPVVEGTPDLLTREGGEPLAVVARLRRGVSPAEATAAIEGWLRLSTADRPLEERVIGVTLTSKETLNPLTFDLLLGLAPLIAMFALVILAACANVASLMVARGVARQRELGVRLAIGAGRGRVVRQLLTESLLLAVPAAVVGIAASRLMIAAVLRIMMVAIPDSYLAMLRLAPLATDARVTLFAAAVAIGSAVIFGLLPALQATRPDLVRATRGELGDDLRPSRVRRILVAAQIGVAALLLIATGLLLRTNQRGKQLSLGFDPAGVMIVRVADHARERVIQHLREWSPAGGVASTSMVPMMEGTWAVSVQRARTDTLVPAWALEVSADFFTTLRIPLRSGRAFTEDEGNGLAPVAIVNESMVRRMGDQTVILTRPGPKQEPVTRTLRIVGVVPDIATGWIGFGTAQPTIFLAGPLTEPRRGLLVRTADASPAGARALEERLEATDPGAIDAIFSLSDAFVVSTFPLVLGTWIGLLIGTIALFLTLSGVYGVMAFTVARRSREIGVRIALGASAGRVMRLVLRETMTLAGWGIAVGALLAAAVAAVVASGIPLVRVIEPLVYLGGAAVVLAGCLLGAAVPSRRAARVQPLEAIRAD